MSLIYYQSIYSTSNTSNENMQRCVPSLAEMGYNRWSQLHRETNANTYVFSLFFDLFFSVDVLL